MNPTLQQCRGHGCRAWFSTDLDACPFCDASVKWMRAWRIMDWIMGAVALIAVAALTYRIY